MIGYFDSDWCGDKSDRKNTLGYIFKFLKAPISWCFKKQPIVALSTCKAEYISYQAIWLDSVLKELKSKGKKPIQFFVDNKSAINLANNPDSHGRSKHIETKFHFLTI